MRWWGWYWGWPAALIELMCTDTTIYPPIKSRKDGPTKADAEEARRRYEEKKRNGQTYKTVKLSELGIKPIRK